jgi:tetratricopeptide (TPR) repeat protein
MSVTTVAAIALPDEILAKLPPSQPEKFQRSDFIAAGLVFFITLGVYIATLAPNVTLEDSGELITAATKLGVGHPPGYPLWTMSGFLLSHILPYGGLAWRINLLCALFGGAANAVLTLLACHSGRWLLQRWTEPQAQAAVRPYVFYMGLLVGLTIGFSDVMWSQAVISAVHGTLNALFVNLVLILFYFWMLEPQKTHRLVIAVFVFALGLTNHHTLVQIIPAFLLAAFILRAGKFWSVFLAVNLFSLSILAYISWLAGTDQNARDLQAICLAMTYLIFLMTAVVSFFYMREFQPRLFLAGAGSAAAVFAYGHYILGPDEKVVPRYPIQGIHFWQWGGFMHEGWLQIATGRGIFLLLFGALAVGLLFTSKLDRRMVIGVFAAGWLGLMPYAYERFASETHPPMNWGVPSERGGFYYSVSRQQYPMSLPNLIMDTFGKLVHVESKSGEKDISLGQPHYLHRLWLTFYYYGDNLQQNFTVPLIFLVLAILIYFRRCDGPQLNWFIFLGAAFFFLGFMLHFIEPPDGFDFERNLQYKVFHLQSHCIFVLLMGYGALAAMTYLHESVPEVPGKTGAIGFGIPALFLSLLPFLSNFEHDSQAGHWFGYDYGADIMRDMDKDAIYLGGSDPGRFVPTYMAFVESQQPDRWKADHIRGDIPANPPGFDRRDVTVITQNALCDSFYCKYIRDQYDARFRPAQKDFTPFERWLGRDKAYPETPILCISPQELSACWDEYAGLPEVAARVKAFGKEALTREGTSDVFELNGIVAQKLFEKNKRFHTFYLEQSVPIPWMYPYMEPSGLIFKLDPEPLVELSPDMIAADRKFWDAYSKRLLSNPKFRIDDDATSTFAKLAFWHSDLYHWRHLEKEEEYWLKLALALCPQMQDAVSNLSTIYVQQKRYDEAVAMVQQAELDDPRNELYPDILAWIKQSKTFGEREKNLHDAMAKTPPSSPDYVKLNMDYARVLQDQGRFTELNTQMGVLAGLTNWDRAGMSELVQYYVDKMHNLDAAIAFLEVRAKLDPKAGELIYSLAALHAQMGHEDEAIKYLTQSAAIGGTNALISAGIDPRFTGLRQDPRFQALLASQPLTNAAPPPTVPPTNAPAVTPPKPDPAKKPAPQLPL